MEAKTSQSVNLVRLRRLIASRFNDGELRTLCFDLGVDYEDLPGEGKSDKARELVSFLERRNRIPELVEMGKQQRSDIRWESVYHIPPERSQASNGTEEASEAPSLDARILKALYTYYLQHPGSPQMNLNELIAICAAERSEVIRYLWGLHEKRWVEHNLTERADMGSVWLTPQGIGVAKDV